MRRSKLEAHLAILQTLSNHGKLIPTHITCHTYLNCRSVNKCLGFLMENNLVQEMNKNTKRKTYEITTLGLKALQTAKEIDNNLNIFQESLNS